MLLVAAAPACYSHHERAVEEIHERSVLDGCPSGQLLSHAAHPTNGTARVAAGSDGSWHLTGPFRGHVSLGGDTLRSSGYHDVLLATLGPELEHRWSTGFGGSTGGCLEGGTGIAVGRDGALYVTGSFQGTVELGDRAHESDGLCDAFVARFSSAGTFRWFLTLSSPADGDMGAGIDVGPEGDVYVVVTRRKGFLGTTPTPEEAGDIFVARISPDGALRWQRTIGGDGRGGGEVKDVAVDAEGHVYLTGIFTGSVAFGDDLLEARGEQGDVFLASLDEMGRHRWSRRFGGPGRDAGGGLAVDSRGDVYLSGTFQERFEIGRRVLAAQEQDGFVASFTPGGRHRWSVRAGSTGYDVAVQLRSAGPEQIVLTGFVGTSSAAPRHFTANGFIARLGREGRCEWLYRIDGPSRAGYVAIHAHQYVYATARFSGLIEIDDHRLLPEAEEHDLLLLKLRW